MNVYLFFIAEYYSIVDMAHIYNGILLSHKKNEIELFVVRWMDPEAVIQSEF